MWTIAAVNKKFDGPLGSYNGLTDVHLAHYFSRPSRQSHLKAAKLITEDGFIVPERNVKVELYYDDKKRKVYDILARSILQNAVLKEGSWNKKLCNYLEDISKMAAVDIARKTFRRKSGKVASELFPENLVSSNTFENCLSRSASKLSNKTLFKPSSSAPVTCFCFTNDSHLNEVKQKQRSVSAKLNSPYGIPLVLSGAYKEQSQSPFEYQKSSKHKKRKRRKFNNLIGDSATLEKKKMMDNHNMNISIPHQPLKFSQCKVTILYHGHESLANFQKTLTQSILIKQQHCGGIPVVIYKGKISPNELFSFFTLEHEGYFFSMIIFLNGIRELKLSSCCIFRYPPGRRLGGPTGTFSIKNIEGGKPCLNCQYQEFENNKFKFISQSSDFVEENSLQKENSTAALNDEDKPIEKTFIGKEESNGIHENELSIKADASLEELNVVDNVEEVIEDSDDGSYNQDQDIKEELSKEENVNEESASSYEEDIEEEEDSNHSISSESQSDVSRKDVVVPKKYEVSIGTSSSEDEGEKRQLITVSVHGSPEHS